jgi:hypothetical protein
MCAAVKCKYHFHLHDLVTGLTLSQGLKAGLAAGVIYGLFIGIIHLGFLQVCSSTQLAYIARQLATLSPPSSAKPSDIFATDLVIVPIYWGLGSIILGVIYGVAFSFLYRFIPGSDSKQKGFVLGVAVFALGYLLGISGYEIACSPSYISIIPLVISLPMSLAFGYLLGSFYDSFGRYALEQNENREKGDKGITVS